MDSNPSRREVLVDAAAVAAITVLPATASLAAISEPVDHLQWWDK